MKRLQVSNLKGASLRDPIAIPTTLAIFSVPRWFSHIFIFPKLHKNLPTRIAPMDTPPVLLRMDATPSERRYLQPPRSFTLALAPAIHMALQTRNIDDGKQTYPPPSISEIERWIVATFPPHRWCSEKDIFWGITEQVYPPVHWRELSGSPISTTTDQAYQVLRAGRPVLVSLTLRLQEWEFLGRFFGNNKHRQLTRAIYGAQPEIDDNRWDPCYNKTVLWTGYNPATGACTFIHPSMPRSWGNNGAFQIEDLSLLTTTMPMSKLRFYELYCHPGNVIKRSRLILFIQIVLLGSGTLLPGKSLVPHPFAEYQKKKNKPWPGLLERLMTPE